ncbi:MAG: GAF domain-containing protein [Thermodesulfobacteriota bacterium]
MNSFEILSKVIEISNAPVDVDRRLKNLVDMLAHYFTAPLCALFLWDPQQGRLFLKSTSKKYPALPADLSFSLNEGPVGTCASQKTPMIVADASQLSLLGPPCPKILSEFRFIACFPVFDDIFLYGVLVLLGEEPRQLSEEERDIFLVICRQIAGTLRAGQVSLQARKRIAELSTLQAIGTAISSTLDLGELLQRITLTSAKILQADGSLLHFVDEDAGMMKVVSSHGVEEGHSSLAPLALGEEMAGTVSLTGEPIVLRDPKILSHSFQGLPKKVSSLICVPLISQSKTIGTLTLFSLRQDGREGKLFDEEDKNLLFTMASQVAVAIENAIIMHRAEILSKEKERNVRELFLLYEISRSLLTTSKLDPLLRVILLTITLGSQMGFDRAALFLVDEKEGVLKGMMGVGPSDPEQAERWRKALESHSPFSPDWVVPEEMAETPYDNRVRQARIPLGEKHSLLIKTLNEQRSFNVEDALTDPEVNPEILGWFESKAFASVPLIAKGKSIGLIAVDNRFTERPITSADIGFLNLLANQAALAIENSRLYSNLQEINTQLLNTQNRLIQSEKLAALGEVVASIAHEIKNPLVSIGGFVRRMERNLRDNSAEKKYMRIVLKEVNRLENVLNQTLAYSKDIPLPSRAQDINRIIEDSLSILEGEIQERNISIRKDLNPSLPPLPSEPEQIKQVFLNLFLNAIQAMGKNGQLSVKTSVRKREKRESLQIEVEDTGGGIPQENLDNIFNPFFTTKQDGTGLGLAITHKIITGYGGQIEVINHQGAGATFVIQFPLPGKKAEG